MLGKKPIVAMNIVCFPSCHDMNILAEILKGGFDKVKESGASFSRRSYCR